MKHYLLLVALSVILASCGKKEAVEAIPDEAAVDEEQASVEESTESEEAVDEALVVVEESAAEMETEEKPIVLARAEDAEKARNWKYKEGQHFTRLVPTQPTVGGADKIEVAEAFMYSCPHCYTLEVFMNRWVDNKDPNVRFVRIPAAFNRLAQLHAQLYYTEEVLGRNGKLADPAGFRNLVFEEYHNRGNRMNSETAIQRLFARAGVSEEDFASTWNSFEVNQKLRVAADLARRYNVDSVPMIIVNGKYRTTASQAGGNPQLLEVIDELTAREGLR